MRGELFIKTRNTRQNNVVGWFDAFTRWGISVADGGLSRLMTPAPHKQYVTNKNVMSHGESVVQDVFYKDARQIALPLNLIAPSKPLFWSRYASFCREVLNAGAVDIVTRYEPTTVYHCIYIDCTQLSEAGERLATFTLTLDEPNPSVRTGSTPFVTDSQGNVVSYDDNTPIIPDNVHLLTTIEELNRLIEQGASGLIEELTDEEIDAIIV